MALSNSRADHVIQLGEESRRVPVALFWRYCSFLFLFSPKALKGRSTAACLIQPAARLRARK